MYFSWHDIWMDQVRKNLGSVDPVTGKITKSEKPERYIRNKINNH